MQLSKTVSVDFCFDSDEEILIEYNFKMGNNYSFSLSGLRYQFNSQVTNKDLG
jgi:hypothetical protein